MRKVVSLLLVIAMCIVPLFAQGNSESNAGSKLVIRYADVQAENDTETMAARKFAALVDEKSEGKIEVQVFPNGQLGDMKDIIEAVQMGAIEMARNNPAWLADAGAQKMNVFSLPFIFDDLEHANKVIASDIGTELLEDIQKSGLKMIGLGYYEPSLRYFFFKDKEVRNLNDIKGLKLRLPTNEKNTAMGEAFGASATPLAYNEKYS
ncbi:MAG: TRAP transporter substrate-binding protein, partial [Sphaerochaetaceae bacterium]